jgi:peptide/nickel transport system ATP-binding protein
LVVEFKSPAKWVRVVDGISLSLQRGEIVAIVGESGSGKSMLLQSILGIARGKPGVISGQVAVHTAAGEIIRPYEGLEGAIDRKTFENGFTKSISVSKSWASKVEDRIAPIRGKVIGLALQNGRASLDPFWRIGTQLESALIDRHGKLDKKSLRERAEQWLARLGFHDPKQVYGSFPHELSGGMAQRAMLAVVLAREPEILFLDEITTGLDVSLQAGVLVLVRKLHEQFGFSALMVTHDLGMARAISTRTLVMKRGRLIQQAHTSELFRGATHLHPYTRELLESREGGTPEQAAAMGMWRETPILRAEVSLVSKHFGGRRSFFGAKAETAGTSALSNVSLWVHRGECIALVGESGSGKTTLSRLLAGLLTPDRGQIFHDGLLLSLLGGRTLDTFRRNRTILFQNPYTSLNPAMTASGVISEAIELHRGIPAREARRVAREFLDGMGLGALAERRLRSLSGGERRRIGLLRAIQSTADLILLDEPTAGLDAVHRIRVAEMIRESRAKPEAPAIVIVSHDLGFVTSVADRIVVLYRGAVVEECDVPLLLNGEEPQHPYTRRLWAAAKFVAGGEWNGAAQRPSNRSQGRVSVERVDDRSITWAGGSRASD